MEVRLDIRVQNGWTVLYLAVYNNQVSVIKTLLRVYTDVNGLNDFGQTPLMIAADKGYGGVAALLMEKGASLDICDEMSGAALHLAASANQVSVVKLLLMEKN